MRKIITYLFVSLLSFSALGQFYLRGEVKDEKNNLLSGAKIFVHSIKNLYTTGPSGSFGVNIKNINDSLTVSLEGYETVTVKIKADQWQMIVLKVSEDAASKNKNKLISAAKNLNNQTDNKWHTGDETYFKLIENEFNNSIEYPNAGFSLNINKASYSNIRRFLNNGSAVPPDAVRIEELINYFNLHYREPKGIDIFNVETQITSCPWNAEEQLLFVNVSAKKLNLNNVPPGNFVFLMDVSGSMDMPNRLPLIKSAFQLFVKNLRPVDTVSIVTYGGYVKVWLTPTAGSEQKKILEAIESLEAEGDTPGESAIRVAYNLARRTFIMGGNNRIILATDGDFNVGETSEKALEELVSQQRQSGIYLTCLGVGMGNFKDSKLQILAKKGNGNYAYLDDMAEAERVLVKELTQTFYAVADDVSMNIEFNPAIIKKYRLIGFDNKRESLSDAESEVEGGEIGSGSTVMAIFELLPEKQYKISSTQSDVKNNVASINLNYMPHNESVKKLMKYEVPDNFIPEERADRDYRFAAAVSMFGMKLKDSKYLNKQDWPFIINYSKLVADCNVYLEKEFLSLLEKAKKIDGSKSRKKKFLLF